MRLVLLTDQEPVNCSWAKTTRTYFKLESPGSSSVYWRNSGRAVEVLSIAEFQLILSGTQRVRWDFSSYRRYGKQLAERIRVRVPRLTGQILGVLPS